MKNRIKTLEHQQIKEILQKYDKRVIFEKTNVVPDETEMLAELEKCIDIKNMNSKSVLGLDIYQYSSYGEFEQMLIPFLFKTILTTTIDLCIDNHPFIFQKYNREKIEKSFISTGDGGFLIFDTPLHSLLFACNYAITLRIYNAFHFYPRLRKIIGGISTRYAITYDHVYSYNDNHYGRAIINNARILSRDSLNRCLIDEHVHRWFTVNIDGIENLQVLTIEDVSHIHEFNGDYNLLPLATLSDKIFGREASRNEGIINSDILKIGKIKAKETDINIYNLHLQVSMSLVNNDDESQKKIVTVSLGNLNTTGI
ncbi:MAG: hypothetical protein H6541_07110 [Lentimicrobiaceae bacterium]|nr:hypothetical protein [Lentimicrobiaceae bacterium]MCB9024527.1 hypothetical protein [Lentimicrobiaceae bacterium]MCO5266359.1 hypothetical protein [Lentimicrobium sp.]HPG33674.1 hypothetical protein [Lentimicrobium sp.]